MGALRSGLAIVLLFSLTFPQAMASECARLLVKGSQLNSVLHDTLEGLEKLRSESGLIMDTIQVHKDGHFKVLNPATSPSNIAVDFNEIAPGRTRPSG